MTRLPQQLTLEQLQPKWASAINPVLANPLVNGLMLSDVQLSTGFNSIPHRLGRSLQGWFIVRINASAQIYDTQATNQMSGLTLNLTSSADALVSIWVF